jgi:hypothetical protein
VIYRIQWDTVPIKRPDISVGAKNITVYIYDTETSIPDEDDPEIIELEPAANPMTISVVDNAEDKLTPVKGKQAIIRFLSNSAANQDFSTFADSSDKRWLVEISWDEGMILAGYLMAKDIGQDFLPDKVVVELTVSDMLASLRDITLTDFDGNALLGKYKLGVLIAMCLHKCGLDKTIRVINNVRHGTGIYDPSPGAQSIFDAGLNQIIAPSTKPFFYVGQTISITGTASNNGTFTVTSVGVGIVTIVDVAETVVTEGPVSAVYTDETTDGHLYDKIYVDAKTFEKDAGVSEDCRTVLEKILGEDCILFQWHDEWWIYRLDEIDENPLYPATFNELGAFISMDTVMNPTRSIGADSHICHADTGTSVRSDQQHKYVKETYRYVTPKEIVCNMDFSRGDVTTPPDLSAASSTGTYELDCWTVRKTAGGVTSAVSIKREFIYGTETLRYIAITPQSGTATPFDFIESQAVEMRQNDRGSVAVDYRWPTNMSGGGATYFLMKIYLVGDDGNFYYWWNGSTPLDISTFYWTSSATEADRSIPVPFDVGDVNETIWRTLSVNFDAIPVDGKLYIGLYNGHQGESGDDNQDIQYTGLKFTYQPFINGSYQLFTGQYNQVTRTAPGDYNMIREKEVFISDSPRKEFKGALLFLDSNGVYRLASHFYASNVTALAPPTDQFSVHPFGYIQSFSVWNQYRLANRIFPSRLYGLFREASPDEWPDLINKYQLTDSNRNTNERYFLLIAFEQDWRTCRWSGTFIEVYRRDVGHNYDDNHTFNYLTS